MPLIKNDLIFETKYDKRWLKIFYHDSSNKNWFTSDEELLHCNEEDKYSIFEYISPDFKINDYYEFLLEYPGLSGYNNWKQKILPTQAFESITTDIGYTCEPEEGCSCQWTIKSWKGLKRSSKTSYSFIDGSQSSEYWFTIGAKMAYKSQNKFPGPGETVTNVSLWIRVPPKLFLEKSNIITCNKYFHLIKIKSAFIFIIIMK